MAGRDNDTDQSRVRFDRTINLGHILSAGAFLVAALVGWADLRSEQVRIRDDVTRDRERIVALEARRDRDETKLNDIALILSRVATQVEALVRRSQDPRER